MKGKVVQKDRIYRVDAFTTALTYWLLGKDGDAGGLALVAGGDFWCAHPAVGGVGRLDPDAGR